MTIDTTPPSPNGPSTHNTIREKVNELVGAANIAALEQTQTIYVAKVGSDSNAGLNINSPKLTIQAAIVDAAAMLPTSTNQVVVEVLDAGVYTGTTELPEWVHLHAVNAALDGRLTVSDNTLTRIRRLQNSIDTENVIRKLLGSGFAKVEVDLLVVDGVGQEGLSVNNGLMHIDAGVISIDAGIGIKARGGSRVSFIVSEVSLSNGGLGIGTRLTTGDANSYSGNILYASDDGSGTLFETGVDGDTLNIQGGSFSVGTFYSLGVNAVLNAFVNEVSGTRTLNATASANILKNTDVVMGEGEQIKISPDTGQLALYKTSAGVEAFIGEVGGGYTDQLVFTKPLGGLRFKDDDSGFEFFAIRRDVAGDTLGAVFGNFDTLSGNYFATSKSGGFTLCQKSDDDIQQQLGNPASASYIESTLFSFQVTSDQVKPYGGLFLGFSGGETDVDFVDVPFDTRILNAAGTVVYSDIQNIEIFKADPSASTFKLSSVAGAVNLPPSQPFPMDAAETYTIEYEFATAIRLKGDGAQPALVMDSKRLEYYPLNITSAVCQETSDFTITSGSDCKIDTTGGSVTATLHPTVQSVWVGDWANTWSNTNQFIIDYGTGTIPFGTPENGKRFQVVKDGAGYRIYNADGSLHAAVP